MDRRLLTAAQVARRLGRSLSWFLRARPALERDKGFPPPIDGCGNRWDPVAIDAWLNRQLPGPAGQRGAEPADSELLRRAQASIGEVQRVAAQATMHRMGAAPWPA